MPGRTAAWHPPFSGAFLIICLFFPVIPVELFHGVDLHHRFILHVFIGRPHNFHHAEQGAACDPQTRKRHQDRRNAAHRLSGPLLQPFYPEAYTPDNIVHERNQHRHTIATLGLIIRRVGVPEIQHIRHQNRYQ